MNWPFGELVFEELSFGEMHGTLKGPSHSLRHKSESLNREALFSFLVEVVLKRDMLQVGRISLSLCGPELGSCRSWATAEGGGEG